MVGDVAADRRHPRVAAVRGGRGDLQGGEDQHDGAAERLGGDRGHPGKAVPGEDGVHHAQVDGTEPFDERPGAGGRRE